ncbi:MAG TPA: hypothetical protein VGN98_18635, partial [Tianweitania sediminis]|nr:hypothetical protein [Tianweitania sediminis]
MATDLITPSRPHSDSTCENISREEAIKRGLSYYFNGDHCRNGHLSARSLPKGVCMECQRLAARRHRQKLIDLGIVPDEAARAEKSAYNRVYQQTNKDKIKATSKRWRDANRDKVAEAGKRYRAKHPEQVREKSSRDYQANREYLLAKRRQRYAENKEREKSRNLEWHRRNPEYSAAIRKEWKKNNRGKVNADWMKRAKRIRQATPPCPIWPRSPGSMRRPPV